MASVLEEVCEGKGSGLERWAATSQEPPFVWNPFPRKGEKPAHLPVTWDPKEAEALRTETTTVSYNCGSQAVQEGFNLQPKGDMPLPPVTPRDSILSPSRKAFLEAVTLFSYPRNSSPVPTRHPGTDVLVWFDSQELIHPFWLHFSLPVGAAWSSSPLSWQHRAGGPFLEGGKAWKTHVLSFLPCWHGFLPSLTPYDLLYRMLYDVIIFMIFKRNLLHVATVFLNQFRLKAKINGNHQNFISH